MNIEDRFMQYVTKNDDGCWIWEATRDKKGYGKFGAFGNMRLAHRISYILYKDEIPKGFQIDHLCRNHSCVNPKHLEAVTPKENTLRGVKLGSYGSYNRQKTLCIRGHELNGKNLLKKKYGRSCKECFRVYMINYRKKLKSTA